MGEEQRIKVAMGQMLVEGGRLEENLTRAVEMIAQAGRQGCQIVILPECLDLGSGQSGGTADGRRKYPGQ